MGVTFRIESGSGNGMEARVTASGELVVASLSYDETEFRELAVDDQAYNFYTPDSGKNFVITGMLVYGDKQVSSVNNATVVVYEASAPDTATVDKVLIQMEIGQNQGFPLFPLRILVNTGKYVNAKTDDDDIHLTIMGYYISQVA